MKKRNKKEHEQHNTNTPQCSQKSQTVQVPLFLYNNNLEEPPNQTYF